MPAGPGYLSSHTYKQTAFGWFENSEAFSGRAKIVLVLGTNWDCVNLLAWLQERARRKHSRVYYLDRIQIENSTTMAQMWFCRTCSDLLYPKLETLQAGEDKTKRKLLSVCKRCGYKGEAAPGFECVYRNRLVRTAENHLAKVKDDIVSDPTLQRDEVACPQPDCDNNEAVFFQPPQNKDDEKMHLIFVCTACRHKWQG
eukprot:gb/GECG01003662.1/.p1 GENE.gb/GECG01003662.1/~~gb/GECG01003662.1/.p1  ORF type:complete len:199 (+),score=20.63 gb/GECG01003662.1/:1-597(+)